MPTPMLMISATCRTSTWPLPVAAMFVICAIPPVEFVPWAFALPLVTPAAPVGRGGADECDLGAARGAGSACTPPPVVVADGGVATAVAGAGAGGVDRCGLVGLAWWATACRSRVRRSARRPARDRRPACRRPLRVRALPGSRANRRRDQGSVPVRSRVRRRRWPARCRSAAARRPRRRRSRPQPWPRGAHRCAWPDGRCCCSPRRRGPRVPRAHRVCSLYGTLAPGWPVPRGRTAERCSGSCTSVCVTRCGGRGIRVGRLDASPPGIPSSPCAGRDRRSCSAEVDVCLTDGLVGARTTAVRLGDGRGGRVARGRSTRRDGSGAVPRVGRRGALGAGTTRVAGRRTVGVAAADVAAARPPRCAYCPVPL